MVVSEPAFDERAIDEKAGQIVTPLAYPTSLEDVAAQRSTKTVRKDMFQGELCAWLFSIAIDTTHRRIIFNNAVGRCWHGEASRFPERKINYRQLAFQPNENVLSAERDTLAAVDGL